MKRITRTKIIATVGPACDSTATLSQMIDMGVDVFRFNTKHSDSAWHQERIHRVTKLAEQKKIPIGVLVDIQGPEIRIRTKDGLPVSIKKNEILRLKKEFGGKPGFKSITINHVNIIGQLKVDDWALIDDGLQQFKIVKKTKDYLDLRALDDYLVETNKSMNLPGKNVDLPLLSDKDHEFLDLVKRENAEFVALSFVRTRSDIQKLRRELVKRNSDAKVIAKIENKAALENIDEIIEASDGVMIARGDLGVETPLEQLAYWQKTIIKKCREADKPVITATQMLQSMVSHPLPTRAEATDVANAVFDGTDALMLSGETASGKYPLEVVRTMSKIAEYNERFYKFVPKIKPNKELSQTDSISFAVMDILLRQRAYNIDALVIFTETGQTVYKLARFRPNIPLFAITPNDQVRNQLTLSFGVVPLTMKVSARKEISIDNIVAQLLKQKYIQKHHRLLFIRGNQWRVPGHTNRIVIKEVV